MLLARSWLFVPATRPERIAKAQASGAHAVIVDLEDAVPEAEKDAARAALVAALAAAAPTAAPLVVRVNGVDSPWFDADLGACRSKRVAAVVLPKASAPGDVRRVRGALGEVPVLPLIETALGLWNAEPIGREAGVARLVFGSIDFQLDLGVTDEALTTYRAQLVLASRVAGIAPPVDGVTTAIDDVEAVARDAQRARALGFGGKLCIHPKQVAAVNDAFRPTTREVEWARRVVDADAAAGGRAVAVDGAMVDRPVLLRARSILGEAER